MNWEDEDFNFDDLSAEEREEMNRELRRKDSEVRNHPLYKKANDIFDTVNALIESLSKHDKELYGSILLESSMILAPKIAGAMGAESWLLAMQNASIIRYHAQSLLTQTSGLKILTKADKDYVAVLRKELEEFRELFKAWVAAFGKMEYEEYEDEWGLFLRDGD